MWRHFGTALRITLFFTVLTGLFYPGVVTALCQVLFSSKANGSLVRVNGRPVGSSLIGQNFNEPEYFHPRPSAAGNDGYDASASNSFNYGPTNQKLIDRVKASVDKFHRDNPEYTGPIPADLLIASGSGLDPDISPASAEAQADRIAQARGTTVDQVVQLISENITGRTFGLLGEPRVNVLGLNLELDRRFPRK